MAPPATSDPNGHGTAMAGIIAAATDNGSGIAGVGFAGVKVMPVTVLGADGQGQDSDIIEGVVWAVSHGADVINMSFSNPGYSAALQAAIDYAWANDVVVVAATGNDGSSSVTFPAGDRGVVGVSNTDQDDSLHGSSNYGAAAFLGAPGTSIVTLDAGGGTTTITGTSASSAAVAAAAALLRAVDPSASNGVIVGRLARNADAAGTASQTGNGRLNLARAIADTSTDSVKPDGAAPVGSGGPFVGPYVAAAIDQVSFVPGNSTSGATSTWTVKFHTTGSGAVNGTPAGTGKILSPSTQLYIPGVAHRDVYGWLRRPGARSQMPRPSGSTVTISLAGPNPCLPGNSDAELTIAGITNPTVAVTTTYSRDNFTVATSTDTAAQKADADITIYANRADLIATKTNNVGGTVALPNTFTWTIQGKNQGSWPRRSPPARCILTDNLPSSGATYSVTSPATNGAGTTGTINCSIASNNLSCTASGTVTMPVNGTFTVNIVVTPTACRHARESADRRGQSDLPDRPEQQRPRGQRPGHRSQQQRLRGHGHRCGAP